MTSKLIKQFSREINRDGFFDSLLLEEDEWNAAFDKRDGAPFDECWVENNELLKSKNYPDPTDEIEINNLREYVFKSVFRITNNSEVAGYVSDDIGLIGEALAKNELTQWIVKLFEEYKMGRFTS